MSADTKPKPKGPRPSIWDAAESAVQRHLTAIRDEEQRFGLEPLPDTTAVFLAWRRWSADLTNKQICAAVNGVAWRFTRPNTVIGAVFGELVTRLMMNPRAKRPRLRGRKAK